MDTSIQFVTGFLAFLRGLPWVYILVGGGILFAAITHALVRLDYWRKMHASVTTPRRDPDLFPKSGQGQVLAGPVFSEGGAGGAGGNYGVGGSDCAGGGGGHGEVVVVDYLEGGGGVTERD